MSRFCIHWISDKPEERQVPDGCTQVDSHPAGSWVTVDSDLSWADLSDTVGELGTVAKVTC